MKKVKGLMSLSQSFLNYLFFVVKTLFDPKSIKGILKDIYIVSSSVFLRIRVAMVISLRNGLIEPLLSKMYLQKKKETK